MAVSSSLRACCDADRRNHTIRILDAGSACVQAACRFGPLFVWHLSVALALWLLLRSLLPQWGAWHADRLLSFTFILTVLFAFASWRLFEKPVARAGFIALIRPISGDEAEHCGRLISTVVVLACSWSFCGYAVATASEQTSVAQSLGISARLLQQRIMPLWNDAEHRCQGSHGIRCRMVRKWPPSEIR